LSKVDDRGQGEIEGTRKVEWEWPKARRQYEMGTMVVDRQRKGRQTVEGDVDSVKAKAEGLGFRAGLWVLTLTSNSLIPSFLLYCVWPVKNDVIL